VCCKNRYTEHQDIELRSPVVMSPGGGSVMWSTCGCDVSGCPHFGLLTIDSETTYMISSVGTNGLCSAFSASEIVSSSSLTRGGT